MNIRLNKIAKRQQVVKCTEIGKKKKEYVIREYNRLLTHFYVP